MIEHWCELRAMVGTQKEFAARHGLTTAIVEVYAAKWRAKQDWARLARKSDPWLFFDNLLAED